MQLSDFNSASVEEAAALVRACASVDRWVEEIVAGRPYATVADAVAACERAANPWTDAEIDAALARHPRIGERAAGDDADASMSRSEQSGVAEASADLAARLAAGNRAYDERFGHVFLIRAAGRSAEEILAQLEERLGNTPEQERTNAARHLREIAALRLEGSLTA